MKYRIGPQYARTVSQYQCYQFRNVSPNSDELSLLHMAEVLSTAVLTAGLQNVNILRCCGHSSVVFFGDLDNRTTFVIQHTFP